jgi:hypothetical protein
MRRNVPLLIPEFPGDISGEVIRAYYDHASYVILDKNAAGRYILRPATQQTMACMYPCRPLGVMIDSLSRAFSFHLGIRQETSESRTGDQDQGIMMMPFTYLSGRPLE